jgi:phosphoribulokinase
MPHRPFMLGIAGDSGAGKTTLSSGIARLLGVERTTNICVDDYHKYDRKQRKELGITPSTPSATTWTSWSSTCGSSPRGSPS